MSKTALKKEVLEHWQRHSDKAENNINNTVSAHRSALAIIFGSTALGLGSLRILPVSDIVYLAGGFMVLSGAAHVFYANRHYAMKKKFYETVQDYAEDKYNKAQNGDFGDIKKQEGFITYKNIESIVAEKFAPKRVFKTGEHVANQTGILSVLSVVSLAWFLSTQEPNETVTINSRQERNVEVLSVPISPKVIDDMPKKPYHFVPQVQ